MIIAKLGLNIQSAPFLPTYKKIPPNLTGEKFFIYVKGLTNALNECCRKNCPERTGSDKNSERAEVSFEDVFHNKSLLQKILSIIAAEKIIPTAQAPIKIPTVLRKVSASKIFFMASHSFKKFQPSRAWNPAHTRPRKSLPKSYKSSHRRKFSYRFSF